MIHHNKSRGLQRIKKEIVSKAIISELIRFCSYHQTSGNKSLWSQGLQTHQQLTDENKDKPVTLLDSHRRRLSAGPGTEILGANTLMVLGRGVLPTVANCNYVLHSPSSAQGPGQESPRSPSVTGHDCLSHLPITHGWWLYCICFILLCLFIFYSALF